MTSRFEITTTTTTLTLDASRAGTTSFTVTSADPGTITADAVVVPAMGTPLEWFAVASPSRVFPPGHTEQLSVAIAVPPDAAAGSYAFRLRMLLAGGVPEEDFDDSPVISFNVPALPVEPPPPEPVKRPFPWWIVALIGVIVVGVGIAAVAFVVLNPGDPGRLVFLSANSGAGTVACELAAREGDYPMATTEGCTDDTARSLVIDGVPASMRVDVFGSPSCSTGTDWAEILTQEQVATYVVNTFEVDAAGPPVSVDYRTPTGPWDDIFVDIVDPALVVAFTDGTEPSARGIDELRTEIEGTGAAISTDVVDTAALTTDQFETMVADAVAQGADTLVVDATGLTAARREELAAAATRFDDIDILWPGTPSPEGLDGKVSCVRVSRVTA